MKKTWILIAVCLTAMPLFTACTKDAEILPMESPAASAAPTGTPTNAPTTPPTVTDDDLMPSATEGAAGTDMTGTDTTGMGVTTVEDALRVSEQIADEVEKLSEIRDADAVVAGNIAIVAVEYDAQYQGGMTERLKSMITERVEMIDKAVTSVHVTDTDENAGAVGELFRKLESAGISFDELRTHLIDLGSRLKQG